MEPALRTEGKVFEQPVIRRSEYVHPDVLQIAHPLPEDRKHAVHFHLHLIRAGLAACAENRHGY